MQNDVAKRALVRCRNTGIAFAALCAALSYACNYCIPLLSKVGARGILHDIAFCMLGLMMISFFFGTLIIGRATLLMTRDLWRRNYFFSWA